MFARMAGSVIFSVAILIVVSLLVTFGVFSWTGSVLISTAIGTMCALAAAFAVDALHAAVERAGERLREEIDLPSSGGIADHARPTGERDVDPNGSPK